MSRTIRISTVLALLFGLILFQLPLLGIDSYKIDAVEANEFSQFVQPRSNFESLILEDVEGSNDLLLSEDTYNCYETLSSSEQNDMFLAEIKFSEALFAEEIQALVESHEVIPRTLIYHWGTHTGWYPVGSINTIYEDIQSFHQNHDDFLNTLLEKQMDNQLDSEQEDMVNAQSRTRLISEIQQQREIIDNTGFKISGLEIFGTKNTVTELESISEIEVARCINLVTVESQGFVDSTDSTFEVSDSPDPDTWVPAGISVIVEDDNYIYSQIIWNDTSGFDNTYLGYEHDIQIIDKDFFRCESFEMLDLPLDGHGEWEECRGPAYSNLPGAYLDTLYEDWDNDTELYTIGSSFSNQILPREIYYTYIDVKNENSDNSSSEVRVTPQLGRWASDTWNPTYWYFCAQYAGYLGPPQACIFGVESSLQIPKFTVFRASSTIFHWGLVILSPTSDFPVTVGPYNAPSTFELIVTKPGMGMSKNDFSISIGDKSISSENIVAFSEEAYGYKLEVTAPTQSSNGSYDLTVTANGFEDTVENAIKYQDVPKVDVFLLVDLSSSFTDDLPIFQAQAPSIIASLKSAYPDIRFGLGSFVDYPINPFGWQVCGDYAYKRIIDLTSDSATILDSIYNLEIYCGRDLAESQLSALYQVATGAGQDLSSQGYAAASIPSGQQANFRDDAVKLILLWTDAGFHLPGDPGDIPYPGPSFNETINAILSLNSPTVAGIASQKEEGSTNSSSFVKVIGISSGTDAVSDLNQLALGTNAIAPAEGVDCDGDGIIDLGPGQPLVCNVLASGEGVGDAITTLVDAGVNDPAYRVYLPIIVSPATAVSPPYAPNNLSALSLDSSRIHLTWNDNSENELGFAIYDGAALVATVEKNITSYTVNNLEANSSHCYKVYAYNNYGVSTFTSVSCASTYIEKLLGLVTENGSPVAGETVELRYFNGSAWTTYSNTITDSGGNYAFTNLPILNGNTYLYVRWLNTSSNSDRLSSWSCWTIFNSTSGSESFVCNFDISGINMLLPAHGTTVSLPYTFSWERRLVTSDSYEINIADVIDLDPYWWTAPSLGYVESYTMSSLPDGFAPNELYGWWMWVYGPDGYGVSYYYYNVTFSNAGEAIISATPMIDYKQLNGLEILIPENQGG
ncbi:MAG: hypothetical protein H6657_14730 [Ardenticatenaceae bacterium]|nr:hypothetical protein [Ardenticatenaceae bacterium]